MKPVHACRAFLVLSVLVVPSPGAAEEVRLVESPALSPDGKSLVFSWRGDLWSAPSEGGDVERLTQHPADDRGPRFSPDGQRIAFVSQRSGVAQVWVMAATGGEPDPITLHSEGASVDDWFPDGETLLLSARRDHFWRNPQRFFRKSLSPEEAPRLVFDDFGNDGTVSPDGRRVLFSREGERWWRKGYRGARASQVWLYDMEGGEFTRLSQGEHDERWPLWMPGGDQILHVSEEDGTFNLYMRNLGTGEKKRLTRFEDDGVTFPAVSRDGSVVVFRRLFDLYRMEPASGAPPRKIELRHGGDALGDRIERTRLDRATQAAFSKDAREIAFVAGGDVWVMDTELREPHQVTRTPEEERDPVFAADFGSILFVSDKDGQCDVWKAERGDDDLYFWQNETFTLTRLTEDSVVESSPRFTPDGQKISFLALRGDVWLMDLDGSNRTRILSSWNEPSYDFSPDGKWIVYAVSDDDFNRDVWIRPLDGSREPFNLTCHPDNEGSPVWSPDGRLIAFTGRRWDTETDVYYAWLRKEDEEKLTRERKLEKALEKMKARKKGKEDDKKKSETKADESGDTPEAPAAEEKDEEKEPVEVVIDFEGIGDRIHRISIPESTESGPLFSPDSKKLAFRATIGGKNGIYTVEIPEKMKPELLTTSLGTSPRWLEEGKQIVWLLNGQPATLSEKGKDESFSFEVFQEVDLPALHLAAFDQAWRTMRDRYYDEALGRRNWDAVRRKYRDVAAGCMTPGELSTVINLMLGELNGSHLGFFAGGRGGAPAEAWRQQTPHLGLRFDESAAGPGLMVRDVIEGAPASRVKSRILPGETVVRINGVTVDPGLELATLFTGPPEPEAELVVRDGAGEERTVRVPTTTYGAVRSLLYEKWMRDLRARVDELSGGTMGYLHVQGMNWPSFQRFEEEIYRVGHGKQGLIIDVRENGGGFTTDHLLTVLTQPLHAITVPRGGGQGYPHDRSVYARWSKPIVVLCNQNSYSNAEIFSHAVKTLHRGKVVGVRTAGGVISTGGTGIMGVGFLRLPFRGWFVLETGEDMELNGCVPDHVVWPLPTEWPRGIDRQLDKAVEVLQAEIEEARSRPRPSLIKATERR